MELSIKEVNGHTSGSLWCKMIMDRNDIHVGTAVSLRKFDFIVGAEAKLLG